MRSIISAWVGVPGLLIHAPNDEPGTFAYSLTCANVKICGSALVLGIEDNEAHANTEINKAVRYDFHYVLVENKRWLCPDCFRATGLPRPIEVR